MPRSLPMRERGLKSFKYLMFAAMFGSLPMRERGLKSRRMRPLRPPPRVAPHAGAWIEIFIFGHHTIARKVAPHAGAWIEITRNQMNLTWNCVAPHAGAWIEINTMRGGS